MKVNQVLQAIAEGQFSDAELRQINEVLVSRLKAGRNAKAAVAKATLEIGMEVRVNHPKLMGKKLVVNEIRRTKVSVDLFNDLGRLCGRYSVPLSIVEAV